MADFGWQNRKNLPATTKICQKPQNSAKQKIVEIAAKPLQSEVNCGKKAANQKQIAEIAEKNRQTLKICGNCGKKSPNLSKVR